MLPKITTKENKIMAANLNKVQLIGRLGTDPEGFQKGKDGSVFGTLSIGTNMVRKDAAGNKIETTEWHKVAVSGKSAEFAAEYLTKGAPVYVEGRLATRSYENKDGQKVYVTEIRASQLQSLASKSDS